MLWLFNVNQCRGTGNTKKRGNSLFFLRLQSVRGEVVCLIVVIVSPLSMSRRHSIIYSSNPFYSKCEYIQEKHMYIWEGYSTHLVCACLSAIFGSINHVYNTLIVTIGFVLAKRKKNSTHGFLWEGFFQHFSLVFTTWQSFCSSLLRKQYTWSSVRGGWTWRHSHMTLECGSACNYRLLPKQIALLECFFSHMSNWCLFTNV